MYHTYRFESSVVLDGTKTAANATTLNERFESSVVLDGTKTKSFARTLRTSLRVVLF